MKNDYQSIRMMRMMNSPVCQEFPVIRRPWGGANHTKLIIELWPDIFKDSQVVAAIEKGYVSTDEYSPEVWVEKCCSGLVYESHFEVEDQLLFIIMHIDPKAVKPSSEYPYMISGRGAGEYSVSVLRQDQLDVTTLYEESFSCK